MVFQDCDSIDAVDQTLRSLRIKSNQIKLAKSNSMPYVAEALENQLLELKQQLSKSIDPEFQALMSLLND
ncbi:MAG: hypothetical protein KME32_36265 [Mojavia pulchra JT2-VF2]|jgi:hypothetical protein|uniref:Uncharacterized protein n=1 Tax=Mojavia pulchra JT2-VF2 TaxID=287848 RepID=A0A951Q859_9NOST|nr:hypothetical protein [Mojavia pulchra JT2-VF2]